MGEHPGAGAEPWRVALPKGLHPRKVSALQAAKANFGRQIFLKTFNGCAQYGYEDIMKLHTNGSGTALLKDFFLSKSCPESKIQKDKSAHLCQ